jgi:hypothetical protein
MTTSEFLTEATRFLADLPAANSHAMTGLPAEEARLMELLGAPEQSSEQASKNRALNATKSAALFSAMVAKAYTPEEVASHIGVSASRLRQRAGESSLFCISSARGRIYPRFQFNDDGTEVPGMGRLLKMIRKDIYPLGLYNFMMLPTNDLDGATPVEWLKAGRPVSEIARLAQSL